MPSTWTLPGRERDLVALVAALRDGRGACLVGAAGVGKSRISEAAAEWAIAEGHHVVVVRATRGASELPLAPFLGLLGAPALEADRPLTGLFADVREQIRRLAGGRPVVLTVDDVDLLDDASAVFLHQAVVGGEARLLATLRADRLIPSEILDLIQRGDLRRLDVHPFGRSDADRVATAIAGTELDAPTLDRLWELCGGNALYLHEVLVAAAEREALVPGPTGSALRELPVDAPNLTAVVEARLAQLAPGLRQALLHLAFAEPCGPDELASVADAQVLAALEDAGLVRAEADGARLRLRLSHPLYGEVMRARAGPLLRRSVLGRLARDLQATGARRRTDVVKLARLAVDGGVDVEEDVLIRATSVSYHSGDLILSARIGRRTFEQTRSFVVGWDLINCLTGTGDLGECEEHLAAWAPTAAGPSGRLGVAMADAHLAFWLAGDATRAEAVYDDALAEVPEDEPDPPIPTITRAELIADRALTAAMAGRPDDALALAEPLLDGQPAQVVIRAAFAAAHALRALGRSRRALEVIERAREAYDAIGQEAVSLSERFLERERVLALACLGRLGDARDAAITIGRDTTNESYQALALSAAAAVDAVSGGSMRALAAIERAAAMTGGVDRFGVATRWSLAVLALVRASTGDLDGAEVALAAFDADHHPARTLDVCAELARARLLRGRGFPEQAREVLRREIERDRALHGVNDEFFASYELVRLDRAEEVADRLDELAAETDGPLYGMMAAQGRGVADLDPATLGDVADGLAAAGFELYASEAAGRAAEAADHRRQPRLATRWRNRSAELRQRCEGEVAVTVIAQGTAAITRREREIALLAAQGISSKQIASRLFISSRTVDNHLAKVYVKLGVRTRTELAAVLGDGAVAV